MYLCVSGQGSPNTSLLTSIIHVELSFWTQLKIISYSNLQKKKINNKNNTSSINFMINTQFKAKHMYRVSQID